MSWAPIEVLVRVTFETYEDWWRWEQQRLREGWVVKSRKEREVLIIEERAR